MKVHLVTKGTILAYTDRHSNGRLFFKLWIDDLKHADWRIPIDIKENFPSADILGNSSNRVVFNIGGNSFRMICEYLFIEKKEVRLYVCWIGTHAEYDKLCAGNKQYTVHDY